MRILIKIQLVGVFILLHTYYISGLLSMSVDSVLPIRIFTIAIVPSLPYVPSANFIQKLLIIFYTAPHPFGILYGLMLWKIFNHPLPLHAHVPTFLHSFSPTYNIAAPGQCPHLLPPPLYFPWQPLKISSPGIISWKARSLFTSPHIKRLTMTNITLFDQSPLGHPT